MGTAARIFLAAAFLLQSAAVLAGPDAGAAGGENPETSTAPPPAGAPEEPTARGLRWKNAAAIGGIAAPVETIQSTNPDFSSGTTHDTPNPAGVSAPVRESPTVTSGFSIRSERSRAPSRSLPAL